VLKDLKLTFIKTLKIVNMSRELDKEMQEGILRIVEESMPKKVGATLAKRLEQADQLEEDYKELLKDKNEYVKRFENSKKEILNLEEIVSEFRKEASDVSDQKKANEKMKFELEAKERNLELELMKVKLEAAQSSKNDIFNLTDRVFRNHTVRETVMKSTIPDRINQYDPNSCQYIDIPTGTESGTITTTKESEDQD
jgi:hypothetical protein